MRQSPLSRPLPNSTLPRNSFDRGYSMNLNFSSGMVLPVLSEFIPAGSKGRLNRSVFLRCAQLKTAAFPIIDYNIDFYLVPLNLLMTRYDEFHLNTQDVNSSVYSGDLSVPSRMPFFKSNEVKLALQNATEKDILGSDLKYGAARLADFLQYSEDYIVPTSYNYPNVDLNAFRILAYQKVYYDHFRNTAYEANDPEAYNADQFFTGNQNGYISDPAVLKKMWTLRYVNYRKDYFQAVYPGLNYVSSQVSQYEGTWNVPQNLVGAVQQSFVIGDTYDDSGRWKYSSGPSAGSQVSSGGNVETWNGGKLAVPSVGVINHDHHFSATIAQTPTDLTNVQAIRAAFALDKLLRASAYAPKHVKDQLEARFGVKLRRTYGHESQYLGSFSNQITIGEVTSTANTTQTSSGVTTGNDLGAIGGKGVSGSSSGKSITFTTESDCLLVGVAYALSRTMYDSDRIDAFNLKHLKEDMFNPEFMDLGLRPLLLMEYHVTGSATANNLLMGYVTRDQEWKCNIDRNHGLFRSGKQLSVFTNHINAEERVGFDPQALTINMSAAYFKVSPSDLNDIFVTAYDPSSQLTDQFFGQLQFKLDVRQNMSVHGQPRL